MLKSIFGTQFRLNAFSLILIPKYKVQEVSTCWNRPLHNHLVLVFAPWPWNGYELLSVTHLDISPTLGITLKRYLAFHLQIFMNCVFCFVNRPQASSGFNVALSQPLHSAWNKGRGECSWLIGKMNVFVWRKKKYSELWVGK